MNPKIKYYENGNKYFESYFNDLDNFHNENGPAFIYYYKNGNKQCEEYYIYGQCHNINGPAFIKYHLNGEIEHKEYYLNNKQIYVNSNEEFKKYIKLLNIS